MTATLPRTPFNRRRHHHRVDVVPTAVLVPYDLTGTSVRLMTESILVVCCIDTIVVLIVLILGHVTKESEAPRENTLAVLR